MFFCCLEGGHGIKECRSSTTCAESLCNDTSHYTLLHPNLPPVEDPAPVCSAINRDFGIHSDKV